MTALRLLIPLSIAIYVAVWLAGVLAQIGGGL